MKTSTTEPASPDRAADTRERLLLAGLTLFSQLGLEGVRTRQLSEAAGVNQSAIPSSFRRQGRRLCGRAGTDRAGHRRAPGPARRAARHGPCSGDAAGGAHARFRHRPAGFRGLRRAQPAAGARTAATHAEVRGDPRRPVHAPARSRDGAGRGHPAGSAGQPRQHPAGPCHPGTGHSLRRRARGAAAAPGRQAPDARHGRRDRRHGRQDALAAARD